MTSLNVTTPGKPHKRIMPYTPVAVTVPDQGKISLLYKGQVFTPGQEYPSDAIYHSIYEDGIWKGGLDAPPAFPIRSTDSSRMAVISWSKTEQRLFYVAENGFLQDSYYSGDQWHTGSLHKHLKVQPPANSSIAAVHWYDLDGKSCVRIFYQEAGHGLQAPIKEIRWNNTDKWHMGQTLVYALPGCGLAAVTYRHHTQQKIHLFYQSMELSLSELYYYEAQDSWLPGAKNMGIAGDSTPITAFNWSDGKDQHMQVYWRNKAFDAEIVGASKSGELSEWKPITDPVIGGLTFDDQFAIAQWGNTNNMRFYYTDVKTPTLVRLLELCNDGAAGWVPGAKFGGDE
ncbi:hypothetical protein BYT27DRAFT_7341110 [Phlegmacium glaucopus]|nr:hypothetical protein BYT27DRAFT_7341110 [Phlegmacium glaucopus]